MQRKALNVVFLSTIKQITNVNKYVPCSYLYLTRNTQSWKVKSVENKKEFVDTNPDVFGTLTAKKDINQILEKLPEEEDDVIKFDVTDDAGKKRRRPLDYYAKLIKKLLDERKVVDAIYVLETRMLKEDRVKPDYYIYNLLINGCARVGYCEKAFKLYKQMKDRHVKKTPPTITGLFNACALSPFPEDALVKLNHLRKTLADEPWDLNLVNYHVLVKAYSRLKDLKSSFLVVDEMMSKGFSLNSETFCFLLQACISDENNGFGYALLVWRKMIDKKVPPTIYSYNLFLRCVRDCGLGKESAVKEIIESITGGRLETFQEHIDGVSNISDNKISLSNSNEVSSNNNDVCEPAEVDKVKELQIRENRPNLLSKDPHMGSIIAVKDIKTSMDRLLLLGGFQSVLNQMDADNVKPNLITFNELLDSIPATLSAEEALLKQMNKYGVEIDIDFCNLLIKKRSMRCEYESARDVLKLIQNSYLNPDIVTFGVLAMSCKQKWEAESLMHDIREFGFRLNAEILGGMLQQACYHYNFEYVIHIMQTIQKMGIHPNKKFMEHLNNLYSRVAEHMKLNKRNRAKQVPKFMTEPSFVEGFRMYREYYQGWKKNITVYEPPHPYEQFKSLKKKVEINESPAKNLKWKEQETESSVNNVEFVKN